MPPYASRRTLFESAALRVGHLARRGPDACGEVEEQSAHVIVFPLAGVFAKHQGPRHKVLGTPSNAVFIAAGEPYRVSFPGGIGEECLTLRFAPTALDPKTVSPPALLPASALLARTALWHRLKGGPRDPLEIEELALQLVCSVSCVETKHALSQRGQVQVERVKEAVAAEPGRRWTLGALAALVGASRFHLARLFRQATGATLHTYVTHARLAAALDRVVDGDDLTTVAIDAGFTSHSHFSARFRSVFGHAPSHLRKILTAPLPAAA